MVVSGQAGAPDARPIPRLDPVVIWTVLLLLAALPVLWFGFEGLAKEWPRPQYRFKPLVPVVALFMFVQVARTLPAAGAAPSRRWPGALLVLVALILAVFGNLVWVDDFVFIAMIVFVAGVVVVATGIERGLRFWAPVSSLALMLPLPRFIYAPIHSVLEEAAVAAGLPIARLLGVTVARDGQLLDFAVTRLPVSEVTSSLYALMPVMLFFFLFAALFRGPLWLRLVPLLLALPLVAGLTALRVAALGLHATPLDAAMGEFPLWANDWVFLLTCIALLLGLVACLRVRFPERSNRKDTRPKAARPPLEAGHSPRWMIISAILTALVSGVFLLGFARADTLVERETFGLFPPERDGWTGSFSRIDPATETILGADDYINIDFSHPEERATVNFWSAYYAEQEGDSYAIHSPQDCLPNDGWNILSFQTVSLNVPDFRTGALTANRAVIARGDSRALVYYWFEGRGQSIADERMARLSAKFDKLLKGRTDGALVRYVTAILPDDAGDAPDARIHRLIRATASQLPRFIPEHRG